MIRDRFQNAVEIITKNDRGGYTVPTSKLYPHQWNWDSAFTALGISYAVTDDFTVAYSTSESKKGSDADKQEASGISASYTSGGITVAGAMNDVDNVAFDSTNDTDGYEFNIAFAF